MVTKRILLSLILFLLMAPLATAGDDNLACRVFTEDPLQKKLSSSWLPGSIQLSPDNQNVAFIKMAGDKKEVVINEQTLAVYNEIVGNHLYFSPDGRRLVFIIKQNGQYQVIDNGREGKPYQAIGPAALVFSPDGGNFAYTAQSNGQWCLVLNDQAGKKYDSIAGSSIAFSNDGRRLIYAAQLGEKWFIIQDQQESKAYDGVRRATISPDGRHWAAIVRQGDKLMVEFDGVAGAPYQMIKASSLSFSPDSKHLTYVVEQEGKQFVVIDGKEEKAYQAIGTAGVKFSPGGTQMVYSAQQDGKWLVVTNGKPGPKYDGIMEGTPFFSPDDTKVVYAAQLGSEWFVVLNGVETQHYQAIGAGTICFSPNSKHLAYAVKTKDKWQVVLDGQTGRFYDEIGHNSLKFNYDSENFVFSAKRGSDWFVVLDGSEGRIYDSIINGSNGAIYFDEPAYFNYFAISNSQLLWIEERVPGKQSFRDFKTLEGIHSQPDQTIQAPNKTFTFTFNPPDGISYLQNIKIVDILKSDFGLISSSKVVLKQKVTINRINSGFRITWQMLSVTGSTAEEPLDPAIGTALEGMTYNCEIDALGKLVKINGVDEVNQALKAKWPPELYNQFTSNFNEVTLRQEWQNNVEKLLGKSFKIGDIWQVTEALPLPNGERLQVEALFRFAQEVKEGVLIQFIMKFDPKTLNSFVQQELLKKMKDNTSGISYEPLFEIKGEGEFIIDPATLLNYSERTLVTMKMTFEIPDSGKKSMFFERRIENTYEYATSNQKPSETSIKAN